ncbi:hypothetical protein [Streptomyces sp. SID11385]|uniref:hypothetical protein n=1 Tax=Streptomyces sp. SID11385 TaxID=2706031 RepID=UPI0013CA4BE2|nr:hypothetical protein [Streptomyces sp. SID11385]NEA43446.1 hypothetical protein [Streptomyces sp. SID11385]
MVRTRIAAFAARHGWYFRGGVPGRVRWVVGGVLVVAGAGDVAGGDWWGLAAVGFGVCVPLLTLHRLPRAARPGARPLDVPGPPQG